MGFEVLFLIVFKDFLLGGNSADTQQQSGDQAAEQAGINPKVFRKYWNEGVKMLKEEIKHAEEYNVNGSPTVIWEGRVVTDMGSLAEIPGFEGLAQTYGSAAAQAPAGQC